MSKEKQSWKGEDGYATTVDDVEDYNEEVITNSTILELIKQQSEMVGIELLLLFRISLSSSNFHFKVCNSHLTEQQPKWNYRAHGKIKSLIEWVKQIFVLKSLDFFYFFV